MALQQNETVSITLKIEGEKARNELAILEKESRNLEKAIREVPKGSAEWAELNKQINANTASQTKLRAEIGLSGLTYKQLQTEAKNLTRELSKMTPGTTDFIEKSKRLSEVTSRTKEVKNEMTGLGNALDEPNKKGLWGKMVTGVNTVKTAMNAFLALAAIQFIYDLGMKIFDTTSKFEKYDKVLTTALGSQKEAASSMAAIQKMAANTTFGVDELTEGYVKLVNRGLRPSQKEMTALADLAASQGKTFDDVVEAALDAATGENERLKAFGISASKSGDTVTFAFKGMQKTVANTPEAINAAIIAFGEMEGIAGQNAIMMETLGGKASNLSDSFDMLMVEIGTYLRPVFVAILDLIIACVPALSLFGKAFGSAALLIKGVVVGIVDTVNNAGMVIFKLGEAAFEAAKGNLAGAKAAITEAGTYGKKALSALSDEGIKTGKEIINIWKNPEGEKAALFAGKKQGEAHQKEVTAAQAKEAEKRQQLKEKELESFRAAEEKFGEKIKADRAKALELIAQLESEHDATVSKNTIDSEEAKINELRRKRLKQINDGLADEQTKEAARTVINRNADAAIEQSKEEFRAKTLKADQELAIKKAENNKFINEQVRQAEMALLDFKELNARGNATKLAEIAKERLAIQLRLLKENLALEEAAEKARIAADYLDKDQAKTAILAVEKRYHQESITADKQAAADKKAIDDDLREKKQANLKGYADAFSMLLEGNISGAISAAAKILQVDKEQMDASTRAMIENIELGAQVAQSAVNFLNDLAQKKAEKAIAEANRERDEKVAILNQELAVTESLITSSSNFVKSLKEAETNRLAELQRILTSETSTEEQKRDALKKYYSDQLQQMKAAEEAKIQDLQRLANLAKTEDEKRAIEAKIALAKKESEEKIRLADEESQSKIQMLNELQEFTVESSATLLTDAEQSSEKQIQLASDEAEKKADFKADLEETIAAENRKARATEMAEKKKAFAAEKRAKVASALISGASAILSALATPPIFVGIVMAAIAAGLTAVQIAKIKNQPEPSFAHGGFIAQGGKHGNSYGTGGIALIDRQSGREVGEMEGDEAIISADQTEANLPLIHEMFRNARTPSLRKVAVSPEKGMRAFRDGGMFESPYWQKEMYLFGSKKRKAQAAAAAAEAEAAAASASAGDMSGDVSFDAGNYSIPGEGSDGGASTAESAAAYAESQKMAEAQLTLLEKIDESIQIMSDNLSEALSQNAQAIGTSLDKMGSEVSSLGTRIDGVRGAVQENVGATRGVEGAVRESNALGVLYGIMDRISNLK